MTEQDIDAETRRLEAAAKAIECKINELAPQAFVPSILRQTADGFQFETFGHHLDDFATSPNGNALFRRAVHQARLDFLEGRLKEMQERAERAEQARETQAQGTARFTPGKFPLDRLDRHARHAGSDP
jgi:hypothetical protein